jgi:hypothetical protein
LTQPSPEPFVSLADLFPGQPRSAVEARGFSCMVIGFGTYAETCLLLPNTGIFSEIGVTTSPLGYVNSSYFRLREDTLRLGDLAALWGRPEVYDQYEYLLFSWFGGSVNATSAYTGRFSFLLPVDRVFFEIPNVSKMNGLLGSLLYRVSSLRGVTSAALVGALSQTSHDILRVRCPMSICPRSAMTAFNRHAR